MDRPTIQLIDQAFARFGSAFLWSMRRRSASEIDDEYARSVATRLMREGNASALDLASSIFDSVERASADTVPV